MKESVVGFINSPYFNIFVGFVGFVIGLWFNLFRDKRREFNAAADIFYNKLGGTEKIQDSDFNSFARHLSRRKARAFHKTAQKYKDATQIIEKQIHYNNPILTQPEINDPESAKQAVEELKKFTKRK